MNQNIVPPATAAATARCGKIARLPLAIRTQLNRRLENNEPHSTILPWLNALPETRNILAAHFQNAPISPQNLSEWRQGGFREWLIREELFEHAARLHESCDTLPVTPETLADNLATVLAARYAALLNNWDGEITPALESQIRLLRALTHDVLQLQKSLHRSATLRAAESRQAKADAEADLQKAKKHALHQLQRRSDAAFIRFHGPEKAAAICAVEDAATIPEIHQALQTHSNPIKPTSPIPNNQFSMTNSQSNPPIPSTDSAPQTHSNPIQPAPPLPPSALNALPTYETILLC